MATRDEAKSHLAGDDLDQVGSPVRRVRSRASGRGSWSRLRFMAVPVFLLVVLPGRATPQGPGVEADHAVGVVPLSDFTGLNPSEDWHLVDSLEFWSIPRDPPTGYYATVNTSTGSTLRQNLHAIVAKHRVFPYTHPSIPSDANHVVDTWDILALADAHPQEPQRVLDVYHNNTLTRQLKGATNDPHYDREHSWPKSLGFPDQSIANAAYSDCHHLYAAYSSYNSSRSNKPYGTGSLDQATEKPTIENLGRGGSLMSDPDSSNYSFPTVWQTWLGRRGDVARSMFYMDVRYEGGQNSAAGFEPELQLTDDASQINQRNVWASGGVAFMGLLPVLRDWHAQDPVDDLERRRNAVVFLFQGNRNPFVDHPEWVPILFGGPTPPSGGTTPTPTASAPVVWINELHYDNVGDDQGEFIEVAGTGGTNLTGWSLVAYNGSGGRVYRTVPLGGSLPSTSNGLGLLAFDFAGLQNGPPDGVALIDPAGRSVQFLGYEGAFTATDGPADDLEATDIGVSESGTTPTGSSLQLRGSGRSATDFVWSITSPATRGVLNTGQEFRAPG